MFHITQCTQVPAGASGSSMIIAKLLVFAGAPFHVNAGEMSAPLQLYCSGMAAPAAKLEIVTVMAPPFAAGACCAKPAIHMRNTRDARVALTRINVGLSIARFLIPIRAASGPQWSPSDRLVG